MNILRTVCTYNQRHVSAEHNCDVKVKLQMADYATMSDTSYLVTVIIHPYTNCVDYVKANCRSIRPSYQ